MQNSSAEGMTRVCPPFRWRLTAWLTGSPGASAEVAAELRGSLFNRMTSLIVSAVMVFGVAVAIALRHPGAWMAAWPVLDGASSLARLVFAGIILRHRRRHAQEVAPANAIPDLYVIAGLAWCASLGFGSALCLASGDAALCAMGSMLAMASMGAQCGRVPGAPRLVMAQFILIGLPFFLGGWLAPDRFIRWGAAVAPAYLVAMVTINRQLHRDFVELVMSRQESRRLALRCSLTDLPNRRMFDRALAAAAAPRPGDAREVYVFCLDLDGFKAVNDAAGHPVGDLLLKAVAARMLRLAPAGSLTARTGGDEFAILAELPTPAAAEALARSLVLALREPFDLLGLPAVRIGVSIGISSGARGTQSAEWLFCAADQALYAAKRAGRNRFRWHGQDRLLPAPPDQAWHDDAA